jgi:hypothetical protein
VNALTRYAVPATISSMPRNRGTKRDRITSSPNGNSQRPQKIDATRIPRPCSLRKKYASASSCFASKTDRYPSPPSRTSAATSFTTLAKTMGTDTRAPRITTSEASASLTGLNSR